ncbi:hypothetical protein [Pedobacter sp. AJM]|uniref:hypothetical protein n=1 Tax=Pedobacter sp. AJM TaxID=2003629 RepID=UPI0015579F89|nr:hypothetical protein [Pedobacter sp. AJM]
MKKLELEKIETINGGSVKHCNLTAAGLGLASFLFAPLGGTAALFAIGCALYDL